MRKNFLICESAEEKASFKSIKDVMNHLEIQMNKDGMEKEIQTFLTSSVAQLFHATLNSSEGYCLKFNIPLGGVTNCFKKLNLVIESVDDAFRADWKYPKGTRMYSDSYYHMLLLLVYYGLKKNNMTMASNAMILMLIKLWNGKCLPFENKINSIVKY